MVLEWAETANYWLDVVKDCAEKYDCPKNWKMYKRYDRMISRMYSYARYLEKQGE
ncbi:MAG: hypothetical protein IIZ94_04915 [Prevotella sp.]|nr:hypothetical protein [Prevotella sp.]